MSERKAIFGPTAIATPANALTLSRLLAAPVFALLIGWWGPSSWLLWVLWSLLASSDGVDGHLARRQGATRSGAFLDPLADKFLVLAALVELAHLGEVAWLAVGLIAGREVAMSAYRTFASGRGVSVPARPVAKVKTFVQDFAVAACLFPPTAHHLVIARSLLWVAVVLTILSGLQYLLDARRLAAPAPSATTTTTGV